MKLTFASRGKEPANRSEAWACATANLGVPGSGSLAAGRSVGYYQLAIAATGFLIMLVTGIQLMIWYAKNGGNLTNGDPFEALATLWRHIRWPLAGLCIAGVAILWAGVTSLQILAAHPKNPVPPRIV